MEKYISKRSVHLGENTFPYCSRIIVVYSLYSCKCLFHDIAIRIKPGSISKTTDKHAAEGSKAVCWGVK